MKTIGRLQSATIFWLGFLCTASTLVSANPPSTMSDPVTNMSICQEKAEARRGDERKQFLRECLRTTYAERMTDVDRMRQAQSGDGPKEFVDAVINNVARAWTSFRISLSSHQPYNLQMKNCIMLNSAEV